MLVCCVRWGGKRLLLLLSRGVLTLSLESLTLIFFLFFFFVCLLLSLMLQNGRATQVTSDKYVASHDGSVVP